MTKLLLLGIGIMLLIEGALYGLFTKKMKKMMKIMIEQSDKNIRNAAILFCFIGCFLIYFGIKE